MDTYLCAPTAFVSTCIFALEVLITPEKPDLDVDRECLQASAPAPHIFLRACVFMLIVKHVMSNLESLPGKDPAA